MLTLQVCRRNSFVQFQCVTNRHTGQASVPHSVYPLLASRCSIRTDAVDALTSAMHLHPQHWSLCNMHHIYFNTLPRVWCCCGHQKCAAVDLFQIEYNTNDTLSAVHRSAGPQCILARYRRMMQRPTDTLSHKHPTSEFCNPPPPH